MSQFKIKHFVYNCGNISEETLNKNNLDNSIVYAEDLLVEITNHLNIGPIARHLFGLKVDSVNVWLAPNQSLSEITDPEYRILKLRIRFKPSNLEYLQSLDKTAFNYYYCQVRDEFHRSELTESQQNQTPNPSGLIITDVLNYVMEKNIPIVDSLKHINLSYFLPKTKSKYKKHIIKLQSHTILETLFQSSASTKRNPDVVKLEFIRGLIGQDSSLIADTTAEVYFVKFFGSNKDSRLNNGFNSSNSYMTQEVRVFPYHDIGIFIHSPSSNKDWTKICSIKDIFLISQTNGFTIEIARRNGISVYFQFSDVFQFKSFISLLDGYHRLSINWFFNICNLVIPPSFEFRKKNRCHGPVDREFSINKLKLKSDKKVGTFLLRESSLKYDEYEIDIIVKEGIQNVKINRKGNQYFVQGFQISFSSFLEMMRTLTLSTSDGMNISLGYCIPPFENEQDPACLMLCRDVSSYKSSSKKQEIVIPRVFKSDEINLKDSTLLKVKGNFSIYLVEVLNQNVILKRYKNENNTQPFFQQVHRWFHLQSDFIAKTYGICLYSPLAFLREYFPLGQLDDFLKANRQNIKVVELIECVTYLSHALWFLYDNNITHGRIRCHSLLVAEYSSRSFKIKLSDPLNEMNENYERAWIPPEFDSSSCDLNFSSLIDVWAFGTTLWEIFSYGSKPSCTNVYNLLQPFACPALVWSLILECWNADNNLRIMPQAIVRDVNQIFYQFYNQKRNNPPKYMTPNYFPRNKSKGLLNFINLKKKDDSKAEQDSEYNFLDGNDEEDDDEIDVDDFKNEDEFNSNEPWIIDANSLQFVTGKDCRVQILGKGNYGEVIKAKYISSLDSNEEFVAVKRLNKTFKDDFSKRNAEIMKDMEREFKIMAQLHHENIVKIIGVVKSPEMMLIMEFIELGSLDKYLRHIRSGLLNIKTIPLEKFALDIVKGMEYLEQKRIVHRDLAARNILMSSLNHLKIADFGLAQCLEANENFYTIRTARYLPFKWYAPESIKPQPVFSHKSDVWSYGITLWEIYSFGKDPNYPGHNNRDQLQLCNILENGVRLPCPDEKFPCPSNIYSLMLKCWRKKEVDRPSFTELKIELKALTET